MAPEREAGDESFELEIARELLEVVPRIMRRVRTEMRATAKPQLTIAQLRILAKLYRGGSTITDLSDWQGVSAPAMSKMVGILEGRNLVQRAVQSQDRRHVSVTLTEEGRKTFLSIRKVVRVKIADQIRSVPDSEKEVIFKALEILGKIYD